MRKRTRREGAAISRRSLLSGAGLAAAAAALLPRKGGVHAAPVEESAARVQGPGTESITLEVNGASRPLRVEPRQTLLEVLREDLRLTGAKPVCDRGHCGACTVWLAGIPVYACMILAVEAEGEPVTTVEGLGSPERLHPVQRAFVDEDALQCGFCTPGMIMACAYAVKRHGKNLTTQKAREALSGNLCRCGAHPHLIRAALRAARSSG